MNKIIFSIFILLLTIQVKGQNVEHLNLSSRNTVYVELLGSGGIYSVNFDRILIPSDTFNVAGRIGLTYLPVIEEFNDHPTIGFPFEISFLFGEKNGKLELGIGATYFYAFEELKNSSYTIFVPRIGYRLQKDQGGLFIKTGFTPWIPVFAGSVNPGIVPMIGFALGHTFKNKGY